MRLEKVSTDYDTSYLLHIECDTYLIRGVGYSMKLNPFYRTEWLAYCSRNFDKVEALDIENNSDIMDRFYQTFPSIVASKKLTKQRILRLF